MNSLNTERLYVLIGLFSSQKLSQQKRLNKESVIVKLREMFEEEIHLFIHY